MVILFGAQAAEYVALLADLREGRLVRAPEPAKVAEPYVDRVLRVVDGGQRSAPETVGRMDPRDWQDVQTGIRGLERPQLETGHMLGMARRMAEDGASKDAILERMSLGLAL